MRLQHQRDERGDYLLVTADDGATFTVDMTDYGIVFGRRWFIVKGPSKYGQYIARSGKRGLVLLHREIMEAPADLTVDHEDGNPFNNRRYNLRLCTFAQNCSSRHNFKRGKSGRRGVYPTREGKWQAIISIGNVKRSLGTFADLDDAARAWDAGARELRGAFTQTNFPA